MLTGILAGPIAGLRYKTPHYGGLTSPDGSFNYDEGDRVVFLLGQIIIGTVRGAPRITLADMVSRVDGSLHKLLDPGLTNIARLVFTLHNGTGRDHGTNIPPAVHEVIAARRIDFRTGLVMTGNPAGQVEAFTSDPMVRTLLDDLDRAGIYDSPRVLCSPANARNELRRNILGILRFRDVCIPLQNGLCVYADVFRPDKPGEFPVIMNCGVYGKAFDHHSIGNDDDFEHHEQLEEGYFSGNDQGLVWENHESVDTAIWVPHDYAVVRVDGPGTGRSPGTVDVWGYSTAEAYRDAIDWAGEQAWCNGNVGLWGMSYYAVDQHFAASLRPKHLKAMIAIGTDVDLYEEIAYNGGILNEAFFAMWWKAAIVPAILGEHTGPDFQAMLRKHEFKDSNLNEAYGPRSKIFMSPDLSQVDVPLWSVIATTHFAHFHQLGSSEAYLQTPTPHKKLSFWEDWFVRSYNQEHVKQHMAFFDYWLKGVPNGIMDTPPIEIEVRTGLGGSFMMHEAEWPIPRTEYRRWYFDATTTPGVTGPLPTYRLETAEPSTTKSATYGADADPANLRMSGVSFVGEAVSADMVIAGYGWVRLWVSSTSHDMDVYISIRILDDHGAEVDYTGQDNMFGNAKTMPAMQGWLKVSHRMLDPARTTKYTPKHTHRKADYSPLRGKGDIVPIDVEIVPNAMLVRKGHRIRVDVHPYDCPASGTKHRYDATYHDGAENTIHTGPEYVGYVQLPVVPRV